MKKVYKIKIDQMMFFMFKCFLTFHNVIHCKKFQGNFESPDKGHKMTLVGRCEITDGMKITDIS